MCKPGDPCAGNPPAPQLYDVAPVTGVTGVADVAQTFGASGASWQDTPGSRPGLLMSSFELTSDHTTADLEGTPAVVRATDPVTSALQALGLGGSATPTTADPAPPATSASATPSWVTWVAIGLAALILITAGAFAVASGD